MNKAAIVQKIVAALEEELGHYEQSARSAHAEATDEQSRAEHKYDTRGLEASYLAHGQSRQALEVVQALEAFAALPLRLFAAGEGADLGALVEVDVGGASTWYFLGPRAGGTEVRHSGKEITVLTPQAPLGGALVGKRVGERFTLALGREQRPCRVVTVL